MEPNSKKGIDYYDTIHDQKLKSLRYTRSITLRENMNFCFSFKWINKFLFLIPKFRDVFLSKFSFWEKGNMTFSIIANNFAIRKCNLWIKQLATPLGSCSFDVWAWRRFWSEVLTSRPPLKQTVLGGFDFAKIIAGGLKN